MRLATSLFLLLSIGNVLARDRKGQTFPNADNIPAVADSSVRLIGRSEPNCGGSDYHVYDIPYSDIGSFYTPNKVSGTPKGSNPDNYIGTSATIQTGIQWGVDRSFTICPHHNPDEYNNDGCYTITANSGEQFCAGKGAEGNLNILSAFAGGFN